jgi:predicted transglutaminase-like cysteine proteinase
MTPEKMAELTALNREINAIPYTDLQGANEPADLWIDTPIPGEMWVCRDFVLAKAQRLRENGWRPSALQVVLCFTEPPDSGYHAVLSVTVDGEKWILDSRSDDPYLMQIPSPNLYTWERIQVAGTDQFEPVA